MSVSNRRATVLLAAAVAFSATATISSHAEACSTAAGSAKAIYPAQDAVVTPDTHVFVATAGGTLSLDAFELLQGDAVVGGELTVVETTITRLDRGLFQDLYVLTPTEELTSGQRYSVRVTYEFEESDPDVSAFTVLDGSGLDVPEPPQAVRWYDDQLTDVAFGDTCHGRWDHRVHLEIDADSDVAVDDPVYFRVIIESATDEFENEEAYIMGEHLVEDDEPHQTTLSSVIYLPVGFKVDCITTMMVDLEGTQSSLARLCQPDKCSIRAETEFWDDIDWGSIDGCETIGDGGGEEDGFVEVEPDMGETPDMGLEPDADDAGPTDAGESPDGAVADPSDEPDAVEFDAAEGDSVDDTRQDTGPVDVGTRSRPDTTTTESTSTTQIDSGCCSMVNSSPSHHLPAFLLLVGVLLGARGRTRSHRS